MGDWVHSTLTVLNAHAERIESVLCEELARDSNKDPDSREGHTTFSFETNYGRFQKSDLVIKAGIPFDFYWAGGGDFAPGTWHVRFTDKGEMDQLLLIEGDENPSIDALLVLIDDPAALRTSLLNFKEGITPLPWDNQEEYGKHYLAKQLITPKEPAN